MTNPLFSIITVTKNNLEGLKRTHTSLDYQSCSNYEWIVIDGNSNDGSTEFLKTTKALFISEEDQGIYDAMNKGIKKSTGDYLIFMTGGDTFANDNVLSVLMQAVQNSHPDFIYGDALEIINGKNILKKSRDYTYILQGMFTHHQAMVYRKNLLPKFKYSTTYDIAGDYELTLRFLGHAKEISYLPSPLCIFEGGGISQQQALKGRLEQFKIRKQLDIGILQNFLIFSGQTALFIVRQISPNIYLRLRDFLTKA